MTLGPEGPAATQNHYQRTSHKPLTEGGEDRNSPRAPPTYPRRRFLSSDETNTRWTSARTDARQAYRKKERVNKTPPQCGPYTEPPHFRETNDAFFCSAYIMRKKTRLLATEKYPRELSLRAPYATPKGGGVLKDAR